MMAVAVTKVRAEFVTVFHSKMNTLNALGLFHVQYFDLLLLLLRLPLKTVFLIAAQS